MRDICIDIDAARQAIDQAEQNMRETIAVVMRQHELLKRARKAMLRVTINRVTADEWEAVDPGLMEALRQEVNP